MPNAPPPDGVKLRWQLGAHDQLERLVLVEARLAFEAKHIAERWLSIYGLPAELGSLQQLKKYKSNGQRPSAGVVIVTELDGEIVERTLTPTEIET